MKLTRRAVLRGFAGTVVGLGALTAGGSTVALRKSPEEVVTDITRDIFGENPQDTPAIHAFAEYFVETYHVAASPLERRLAFAACDAFRSNPSVLNSLRLHKLASHVWRIPDQVVQSFRHQTTFFLRVNDNDPLEFFRPDPEEIFYCHNIFAQYDFED